MNKILQSNIAFMLKKCAGGGFLITTIKTIVTLEKNMMSNLGSAVFFSNFAA